MDAAVPHRAPQAGQTMIVHFTTVHPRDDSRIRSKEVASLAQAYVSQVALYVQDGLGSETDAGQGYSVVDTGPRLGRLPRMVVGGWRMFDAIRRAKPRVAQFHDPELLPWAILLRLWGIKVVYDVHEDVPRQVLHNPGLPGWLRPLLPGLVGMIEWVGARLLSGVVAATPEIAVRFPARNTVLVQNYPLIGELDSPNQSPMSARPRDFVYVGGLTRHRGLFTMIDAIERVAGEGARLLIAGRFNTPDDQARAEQSPGWASVRFEGWAGRSQVSALLSSARAGLVTLFPIRNYIEARPVKLFEYMSAGLPVIASDFPRWSEIVLGSGCGLLVDPENPDSIAKAMQWVLDHPDEAQEMGQKGRQAVLDHYNWDREAEKLVTFYDALLGADAKAAQS